MKRDTIFYRIFQQSPTLLLNLLPTPPPNTEGYRFESIEVKETSFRIDGVLIPPDDRGTVVFSEIQMQLNLKLYERMFSEIGIYTYRNTEQFNDWRAIALYPTRSSEQPTTKVPPELFRSGRILPIYLDEIGDIEQLPLGIGILVLTILEGDEAIAQAKQMADRAKQGANGDGIMEMIATILVYKFTTLSRDEVNAMLNYTIDELRQTRFYQEVKAEGVEEGREAAFLDILFMQLQSKFGELPSKAETNVRKLTIDRLQSLSVDLLGFKTIKDLEAWFKAEKKESL
jgi:predicted transposase/invertase (TIGR01784 family)